MQLDKAAPPLKAWVVVISAGIVLAFGVQVLLGTTFGVFMTSLQKAFNWTRTEVVFALSFMTVVTPFAASATGWLVDRINVRQLVLFSLALQGLSLLTISRMNGNLLIYYGLFVFAYLAALGSSIFPMGKIINGWFSGNRGLAIGIMFSVASCGHMIHPLLAHTLIEQMGWRGAYEIFAVLVLVVAGGSALLWLRESPNVGDQYQKPDSSRPEINSDSESSNVFAAVKTHSFFLLLLLSLFYGLGYSSLYFHFVPILQEYGLSSLQAASAQSFSGLGILVGNLIVGPMLDRIHGRHLAMLAMAMPAVAVALLYLHPEPVTAYAMGISLGFAAGAETTILIYLLSRYFPYAIFGRVLGLQTVAIGVGMGIGSLSSAKLSELMGSYNSVLIFAVGIFTIGSLLPTALGKYRY